jgi:PAS domain-containing protein
MQPLPVEPNVGLAWVMLGSQAVVSVDPVFTDFFGFKPEELLGAQLEDWLVEPEKAKKWVAMLQLPLCHQCSLQLCCCFHSWD